MWLKCRIIKHGLDKNVILPIVVIFPVAVSFQIIVQSTINTLPWLLCHLPL